MHFSLGNRVRLHLKNKASKQTKEDRKRERERKEGKKEGRKEEKAQGILGAS